MKPFNMATTRLPPDVAQLLHRTPRFTSYLLCPIKTKACSSQGRCRMAGTYSKHCTSTYSIDATLLHGMGTFFRSMMGPGSGFALVAKALLTARADANAVSQALGGRKCSDIFCCRWFLLTCSGVPNIFGTYPNNLKYG